MAHCGCNEIFRCAEAHAIRDRHQAARALEARVEESQRYTQHLYAAGLMAYPSTATPTWQCGEACEPDAPCNR